MADMSCEYIMFLEPGREGMVDNPTPEEGTKVEAHFQYLKSLTDRGVVVMAGRTTEPPFTGIVVFRSEDGTAAEAIMSNDPAVEAGVFRGRISEFRIALLQGQA